MLMLTIFTMVHGTKVIYVYNQKDHQRSFLLTGNILLIPGEKNKCKDSRVPDKTGKCENAKNILM